MTKMQEIRELKSKIQGLRNQNEGMRDKCIRLEKECAELRAGAKQVTGLVDAILALMARENGAEVDGGYELFFHSEDLRQYMERWKVETTKSEGALKVHATKKE